MVTMMVKEWHELTKISDGKPVTIERVCLVESDITIEGNFSLPPLASLSVEDQVFVMAFIRCHGSIKDMEEMFGVSYPTIKNRLNRIAKQFKFVEIIKPSPEEEVIDKLERGEISTDEAIRRLVK